MLIVLASSNNTIHPRSVHTKLLISVSDIDGFISKRKVLPFNISTSYIVSRGQPCNMTFCLILHELFFADLTLFSATPFGYPAYKFVLFYCNGLLAVALYSFILMRITPAVFSAASLV